MAASHAVRGVSPFWTAVVLTVTLSLPQGFLALPIAAAGVGTLPTIALIVLVGLLNIITMACMSEAVAGSAALRSGCGFMGQLAGAYLGRPGSAVLTMAMAGLFFLALLASSMGLATTLSDFTRLMPEVWAAGLFLLGLYLLSRDSLKLSVGLMAVLGMINVVLILTLSSLALSHGRLENLLYVNVTFLDPRSFNPSVLNRLLGVVLILYFAQALTGQVARVVFPRDPGGRSLIRGSVVGTLFSTALFCLWVLAVNSVLAPEILNGHRGTVLGPLSQQLGPIAKMIASILGVLLLGMTAFRCSNVLFNLVRERVARERRGSFLLAVSPLLAAGCIVECLLLLGRGSFAGVLGFGGVVTISLIAGIFPVLLLVSARAKGLSAPGIGSRFLGHPLVLTGTYLLFLGNLFVHGLLIWQNPLERAGALFVGIVVVVMTVALHRRGVFGRALMAAPAQVPIPQVVSVYR